MTAPIVNYLLAPYENGFWEVRAAWNPSSPFAKYLLDKLSTLVDIENETEAATFLPVASARKLPDEKRAELLRASSRLSSIHALFRAAMKTAEGNPLPKHSDVDSWIERVDLKQVSSAFPEAWKVFTERIYFEGFNTGFAPSKPYRVRAGLVTLLEAPSTSGTIHVIAMGRDELCALTDFYLSLGALANASIRRVFAPDDDLFRPNFPMVSSVLTHVVSDSQISKIFAQALAYYEEDDFQHCISTLGLIAEDYLQRVYTTLLREPLPGGMTLGQTLERLHKRIDDLLPQPKIAQKALDSVYENIKMIDASGNADSLKPVLREILSLIQDDRQFYSRKLDDVLRPASRRLVFPARVADSLNELLKWRNAASHNSRIPLGAHEADRTLFCLIGVITWWQNQLGGLNWALERVEIIEKLLFDAKVK